MYCTQNLVYNFLGAVHYLLINDYLFYTENLEKFTSNLKKNWNYKGLTPSEFKKEHSIESLEKLNKIMQEINKK